MLLSLVRLLAATFSFSLIVWLVALAIIVVARYWRHRPLRGSVGAAWHSVHWLIAAFVVLGFLALLARPS